MSEVKGTLLAIVLAVAVFGVVFGLISAAMHDSASTVADRMTESAETQYTPGSVSVIYTIPE